jgi:hypothetical protein
LLIDRKVSLSVYGLVILKVNRFLISIWAGNLKGKPSFLISIRAVNLKGKPCFLISIWAVNLKSKPSFLIII